MIDGHQFVRNFGHFGHVPGEKVGEQILYKLDFQHNLKTVLANVGQFGQVLLERWESKFQTN